jgi:hypothetical protein
MCQVVCDWGLEGGEWMKVNVCLLYGVALVILGAGWGLELLRF